MWKDVLGFGGNQKNLAILEMTGKEGQVSWKQTQDKRGCVGVQVTVMYGVLLDKESGASESSLASCLTTWVVIGAGTSPGQGCLEDCHLPPWGCLRNQEARNRG